MESRIIVFTNDAKKQNRICEALKEYSEVKFTENFHEGISQLTFYVCHLVLIALKDELRVVCELIEIIRKLSGVPIIVISPKSNCQRITILKAGADIVMDYSCNTEEIQLQVSAFIRRYFKEKAMIVKENKVEVNGLIINHSMRTIYWNNTQIFVTRKEFDFLYLLAVTPERVYTYNQIYRIVWQEYAPDDVTNIIWCMVYRLRNKLKYIDSDIADMICNVKEIGYYL